MATTQQVGNLTDFTYDQLMNWAEIATDGKIQDYLNNAANYGVGEEQALLEFLGSNPDAGIHVINNAGGTYTGWFYNNTQQVVTPNTIDSNAATVSRATIRQMVGNRFEDVGGVLTRNMVTFPVSGGLGEKAAYVLGSIGSGVGAVSTGIWLGKTIDSALYNLNPDFWDANGMSTLNPETWNNITVGSDSPFAGLFNFILGLNPDTNEAQMYMQDEALAYMAQYMFQQGVFDPETQIATVDDVASLPSNGANFPPPYPFAHNYMPIITYKNASQSPLYTYNVRNITASDYYVITAIYPDNSLKWAIFSTENFSFQMSQDVVGETPSNWRNFRSNHNSTVGGLRFYYYQTYIIPTQTQYGGISSSIGFSHPLIGNWGTDDIINIIANTYYSINNGTVTTSGGISGVSSQNGATLPDTSSWSDIPSTLLSLEQQYPDSFNNALVWDNYSDDGTPNYTRWVPVPFPDTTSGLDTQPTSGNQTQTSLNTSALPENLVQVLTQLVQQVQPETETQTQTVPENPDPTGTGTTTSTPLPVGNASALWSVYHPTQEQVNSFGAWLWSSPFETNIGKLFQNPIDGVITLHKVFVMPVDSGSNTIVVGTLDSGVGSATITQQYVTVDCGSINCYEQFANVFDYSPYTQASLYLPFIGIVPVDVNDLMRASIHVKYGVDVFTGACLAMVEVSRDGNTVNMYQYSGVCSVEYPITNIQHATMASGILTAAAGAATIASGGIAAPAALAVAGGVASAARSSVGRSSNFSGNAGAMGIKKPYLILQRPQTKVANSFPTSQGYPTNTTVTLGDCSGFVRVKSVHVDTVPATGGEREQIETILKTGVTI